ncbi:TRAP transporter small permease subunit [Haliangium sp.]|uniref:TRAP transporter small permease subunit n=1 Tax=Haliangium sp. TaxID=2663208 RepID=UPI003D13F415
MNAQASPPTSTDPKPSSEAVGLEPLVHHTALPHTRVSVAVDRVIRRIGDAVSWVWAALLAIIVLNVVMRYLFGEGRIEFEELQWHLYSVGFLLGLSYVFECDEHVRVDVLHDRFSLRTQAWIELYGILLLLMPFLLLVGIKAIPFVWDAIETGERSQAPGGLPARWIIKAVLPLGILMLAAAALSRLTRASSLLFDAPQAVPAPHVAAADASDPADDAPAAPDDASDPTAAKE